MRTKVDVSVRVDVRRLPDRRARQPDRSARRLGVDDPASLHDDDLTGYDEVAGDGAHLRHHVAEPVSGERSGHLRGADGLAGSPRPQELPDGRCDDLIAMLRASCAGHHGPFDIRSLALRDPHVLLRARTAPQDDDRAVACGAKLASTEW